MALDHYIPQVHLKNFYSPALESRMYAIRKTNLTKFPCTSRSVCRIEQGNTNPYLTDSRAIEEFLRDVEPLYNAALARLRQGEVDRASIHAIAGFVAYVGCCTPTAMRIHQEPLKAELSFLTAKLDAIGAIPRAPALLGGKTATELLSEGIIEHRIDPKYPQAIGVSTIVGRTSKYGNAHWQILLNTNQEAFLTTDYPIGLELAAGRAIPNWIVPLAPDVAIRIVPDILQKGQPPNLEFRDFSYERMAANPDEVRRLNGILVQCAEDFVFYRDDQNWIEPLVAQFRNCRLNIVIEGVPYRTRFERRSVLRIVCD